MASEGAHDVTVLLERVSAGDQDAASELITLAYSQLRSLAATYAAGQRAGHTLQPTALVHEAFVKMVEGGARFNDRAHFYAVAALAMRQILTDHARRRKAAKRGGDQERVTLDAVELSPVERDIDLEALDAALTELESLDERKHRVTVLRFFGGLSVDDIARVIGVSKTTVENEWRAARAWLTARLAGR